MKKEKKTGIVLANPEEAKWVGIVENAEKAIEQLEREIEINKIIVAGAREKLKEAQDEETESDV